MADDRAGKRRLMVSAVVNVGLRGCSAVLLFVLSIILARMLGARDYGRYSYIIAIVSLLSVLAQFGVPILLIRDIAQYEASEDWGLLRGLVRRTGGIVLIATVVTALLAAVIYTAFFAAGQGTDPSLLFWGLAFMAFLNFGGFCAAALTGFRRPLEGAFPGSIVRPALVIAALLILFEIFGIRVAASEAMALNAGATIIAFLLVLYCLSEGGLQTWHTRFHTIGLGNGLPV